MFIIISKIKGFKYIFQKKMHNLKDLIIISIIFSAIGMLGTYNYINVDGALANTRIIGTVSGGILFGPVVGITSGIIAGLHRYIIDINGITSLPCFISTVFAGILSGILSKKVKDENKWILWNTVWNNIRKV